MKIYIDLLFIQNVSVMCCVLFITSKLIDSKIQFVRIALVSIISSMFSIVSLIYFPQLYDNLLAKIIISAIIVKCCFIAKSNKSLFQKVVLFWIIVFLIGGIVFFSEGSILINSTIIIVSTLTIIASKKIYTKQLLLESIICYISISFDNETMKLKTLVDTGHDVKTIYGEDVIFIKRKLYKKGGTYKERNVSYRTISGIEERKGYKIRNIKIEYGNSVIYKDAVVVSTPNIMENYDAIIGLDLIGGGM